MLYSDLRGWITEVEKFGELRRVPNADWDLEMGALTEVYAREPYPAILFEHVLHHRSGVDNPRRDESLMADKARDSAKKELKMVLGGNIKRLLGAS